MYVRSHSWQCSVLFILLAVISIQPLAAQTITQIVQFATPIDAQDQLVVDGMVNTLAKGLGEVSFGNSTRIGVVGSLQARITLEFNQSQDVPDVVEVDFLENLFVQESIGFNYAVPGTTRQIAFTAAEPEFYFDFATDLDKALPTTPFDVVQDDGEALVQITNRPIVRQDLEQFNVVSTYEGNEPDSLIGLDDFTVLPRQPGIAGFPMQFVVPMSDLQIYYARTGLPVTLDYAGSILLTGEFIVDSPSPLPVVVNTPEPASLILLGMFCAVGLGRRPARISSTNSSRNIG